MAHDLDQLEQEATAALGACADPCALEELRVRYLGSKGLLKAAMAAIKDVAPADKREYGQRANAVKGAVTAAFEAAKARVGAAGPKGPRFDITRPGSIRRPGTAHPISATIREITGIFQRLGFAPVGGPEVEDEFHNFDALNIPAGHPARDEADNFFLRTAPAGAEGGQDVPWLLRSQTSTIQIRAMERCLAGDGLPLRVVAPGRVYRPDTVDATHHYMFHQIEGLAVAEGLTFRDLRGTLELFVREYFGAETRFRLRPHYFPFTEVSAEVDISCPEFSHLKKDWLEILGCGMVHPNVLRAVGIDPERYTGFAFGMGVERMVMLRHGVRDIRAFVENDLRFLHQFA